MVKKTAGLPEGRDGSSKKKSYLRSYKDLKCPYCGSDVYLGLHKCRRCGKGFPDDLILEVDRRKLMHYIPINYPLIAREKYVSYIIGFTMVILFTFLLVIYLGRVPISEDIRINYILSWLFFVVTILPALLMVFYISEPDMRIMTRSNLQLTAITIGTAGLAIGFVGIIQVAFFGAGDSEFVVCAVFIVLSAIAVAVGRPFWPMVTKFQLAMITTSAIFLSWVLLFTFVRENFNDALIDSGGSLLGTSLILFISAITIIAGSYFIFHGMSFQVRLSNSYPTWFAGMTFIAVFAFFRAALFRTTIQLSYLEALILTIGLFLTVFGLFLFVRKKMADGYLGTHLAFSNRVLAQAGSMYAKGEYQGALDRLEKLVNQNPTLPFGETNDHPALELLGIDFVPRRVKEEPIESVADEKLVDEPDGEEEIKEDAGERVGATEGEESSGDKASDTGVVKNDDTDHETKAIDDDEEEELRHAEAVALLKKSTFYEKSGQNQKALACLERSIRLDKGRAEAWVRLGHLISKVGGSWDKIRSYYDWVVDLKLRTIQNWVDFEDVPPVYLLWLMEELSVLKRNLHDMGRVLRTLRTAGTKRDGIIKKKPL